MIDNKKKSEVTDKTEKPGEKRHVIIKKEELVKTIKEKEKEIYKLQEKINESEKNADNYEKYYKESLEKILRLQAEFDNYKKRQEKKQLEFIEFANQELLNKLLAVVDNLERALDSTKKEKNIKAIREGLKNVLEDFYNVLSKEGVKPIVSVKQKFDPAKHEAVMREESDEHSEDIVTEEFRKGYFFKSKVLRPAMVKVAVSTKAKNNNG